jgi:hypothetical protein
MPSMNFTKAREQENPEGDHGQLDGQSSTRLEMSQSAHPWKIPGLWSDHNRQIPSRELDRHRLAVLADTLEEAGCTESAILSPSAPLARRFAATSRLICASA